MYMEIACISTSNYLLDYDCIYIVASWSAFYHIYDVYLYDDYNDNLNYSFKTDIVQNMQ